MTNILRVFKSFLTKLNLLKSSAMDIYTEEKIYSSHQKFHSLIQGKSNSERDAAVVEYLKNVNYESVPNFPKGLEWFNVSEPLSFTKHLKGKIVVLDFFTYCCINCMHILPDLKDIENEFSVEDGLVVIGVHSAKFENEKISSNILAAVQRYNISHPVVNDNESEMWNNCDVHCWPTLLILGPNANPLLMLMGEGHKEDLRLFIRNAIKYYKSKNEISHKKLPLKSAFHLLPDMKGPLLFPGKIASYIDKDNNTELLAISDTGNNRILIVKSDGTLLHQVGGRQLGFKDGTLAEAEFNAPQGLTFRNNSTLFVADTENHAIRKIDLKKNIVATVAGTGVQGTDRKGGQTGTHQEISSPWDVCVFKTTNLNSELVQEVLIIAMAGTHQIWALFLDDTTWWKQQKYTTGTCVCIAGSGKEENRNNQYPHAAGFAQPSGLALCCKNKEVYIADSESSSVRRLSLVDGKVTAVVGADKNPSNLFAFGDTDGKQQEAKLQHLLGVAMSSDEETLLITDTYNHKLKKVNIAENSVVTLSIPKEASHNFHGFSEPAGLCMSADSGKLYVADTNNHIIRVIELDSNFTVESIDELELKLDAPKGTTKIDKSKMQVISSKPVKMNSKGGKLILQLNLNLINGLKLTEDAPQKWSLDLPGPAWSCVPSSGTNMDNIDVVISIPPSDLENATIDFMFDLVTCTEETCLPKNFIIRQPLVLLKEGGITSKHVLQVSIDESKILL